MAVAGAARRYAQAAFDVAREHNALDEWEADFQRLVDVLRDPAVAEFFASPAVPEEAKQQAVQQLLPAPQQQLVRNLVLLLLERGRFAQLPDVAAVFHDLVLEARGIAIADVTTAVELSAEQARQVREQVSHIVGKQVEMHLRVDPAIIGGIVVRVGDELIDGSVRTQLNQLRRRMVGEAVAR